MNIQLYNRLDIADKVIFIGNQTKIELKRNTLTIGTHVLEWRYPRTARMMWHQVVDALNRGEKSFHFSENCYKIDGILKCINMQH
jgi:hypothetical protein